MEPGRLGLGEKNPLGSAAQLSICPPTALLGNQKAPSRSAERCVTPESMHDAKWAELLVTS